MVFNIVKARIKVRGSNSLINYALEQLHHRCWDCLLLFWKHSELSLGDSLPVFSRTKEKGSYPLSLFSFPHLHEPAGSYPQISGLPKANIVFICASPISKNRREMIYDHKSARSNNMSSP